MTRDNFQRMLLRYSLSSRYYKVTYPAATTVSVTPESMTLPEQVCQPRTSQSLSQSVSRLKNINWFTPSVLLLPLQKRTPLYMHFASPSPESKLFYCHSCFSLPLAVFRNHSPHSARGDTPRTMREVDPHLPVTDGVSFLAECAPFAGGTTAKQRQNVENFNSPHWTCGACVR